jgi:phosphatidylserine/phosphatidylglycerophosphate/cardiolipin synthase-like enzyme
MSRNRDTQSKLRKRLKIIGWVCCFIWLGLMVWHASKPLPPGIDVASRSVSMTAAELEFIHDLTARDAWGRQVVEQRIFDAVFAIVDQAQQFIVLDAFLFNDDMGTATTLQRPLSRELADRLLARKRTQPALQVLLNTDPINDVYGGRPSALLARLERGGIHVVRTDLTRLRDSNPVYSAAWRMTAQWFGNGAGGMLPDPFRSQGSVSLRSWLALMNFKANHRKVVAADDGRGDWIAMVMSANPHDASSLHSNVAWRIRGELVESIVDSEINVARFSGFTAAFDLPARMSRARGKEETMQGIFVTEEAIRTSLLAAINATAKGDAIDVAVFYVSDRAIIESLLAASSRGAIVRMILDPNKDAFGIQKDGVPNRPVAHELMAASGGAIEVRWYRTQGEQFHSKLVLVRRGQQLTASLGSANLTRRNLANYNLESNVQADMPVGSSLAKQLQSYFELLWSNDPEKRIEYTAPSGTYDDDSNLKYWRYRLMEATGISTF